MNKDKTSFVQGVFSKVSKKYDLMNDIMSFGLHRTWKNDFISRMAPKEGEKLLDIAGGTGDIAFKFLDAGGEEAVVLDLNKDMLDVGKERGILKYGEKVKWVHGNAEELPFEEETFSVCSIVFGIRNVTNILKALSEIHRVLKKGGKMFCMEFDSPSKDMFGKACNLYYDIAIPKMGKVVVGDSEPYEYLANSIKEFPKPEAFSKMIEDSGMKNVCNIKTFPPVARTYIAYK